MERHRVVLSFVLSFLLLLAPQLFADSNIRSVRASFVQGSVLIDQGKGSGLESALTNMPVTDATRLTTGSDGLAEVELENGSTVRLAGGTNVLFPLMNLATDGAKKTGVSLSHGTMYLDFRKSHHNVFYLFADTMRMEIAKDCHLRVSIEGDQALIAVFHGTISNPTTGFTVHKNQSFRVDLKKHAVVAIAEGIDSFLTDQWDNDRRSFLRYAQKHRGGFNSYAASFGASFLDYGGCQAWAWTPGSGFPWTPYCVDQYWNDNFANTVVKATPPTTTLCPKLPCVHPPGGPFPPRPPRPRETTNTVVLPKTVVPLPPVPFGGETRDSSREGRPARPWDSGNHSGTAPAYVNGSAQSAAIEPRPSRPTIPSNGPHWSPVSPSRGYEGARNSGFDTGRSGPGGSPSRNEGTAGRTPAPSGGSQPPSEPRSAPEPGTSSAPSPSYEPQSTPAPSAPSAPTPSAPSEPASAPAQPSHIPR